MTPDELRALADEATPGPWEISLASLTVTAGEATIQSPLVFLADLDEEELPESEKKADARLIALAPDLARLCAELGEALWLVHECGDALVEEGFGYLVAPAHAALAKLSELKP